MRFLNFGTQWPRPLDLKFAPAVTLVQRYVSTKLEVPTANLSGKSEAQDERIDRRTDGQTDGQTDGVQQ